MEAGWKSGESSIRAVIFDLDGVLVDSSAFHYEAWTAWAAEIGLGERVTRAWFRETFGRRNADVFSTLYDAPPSVEETQRQAERKEQIFRERSRGRLAPLPGAGELVEALHASGFRLALGTSAPRVNATMIIAELKLTDFFDVHVTGDDVTDGKPDPQVFQRAAERLGIPSERALVIEDAVSGVEAAHRAGMAAIAVTDDPSAKHRKADLVVSSLTELDVDTIASLIERRGAR